MAERRGDDTGLIAAHGVSGAILAGLSLSVLALGAAALASGIGWHVMGLAAVILGGGGLAVALLAERRHGRATEAALRQVRDERQLLVESVEAAPTPFALYDADDRLVAWNASYQRLHDPAFSSLPKPIRYEDLMRGVARQLLPPDEVEAAVKHRVAVHRSGSGAPVDRQYPGGVWFRVCKQQTPSGAVAGFASDVTELKRREAELLASEARLRDYAETASDWFWETGPDHRMIFVSSRLPECGFDAAAWLGRTCAEIAERNAEHGDIWVRHAAILEDRAPFRELIFRARSAAGGLRDVTLSGKPIFDAQRRFLGYRGVGRDVTGEKEVERRRRDLELRLQHSQRIEALGTLAGGIAHDLNNTMVPVVALSKLVMRKLPENAPDYASLAMIHAAGNRARDLVKQILAFSRKEEPTRQPFDLAALLREMLPMVRAMVPTTIEIGLTAASNLPKMLGDPGQLHQVLINLISNAAQAIGREPGRIDIALTAEAAPPETDGRGHVPTVALHLTVRDTGHGMDSTTAQRIFEPFFTTKDVGEGTGLGLAVVHGIVTAHGGSIDVVSAPADGTCFTVVLPAIAPIEISLATTGPALAEAV